MRSNILLAILLGLTVAAAAPSTGPAKSVWDGVYSAEQVERGKKAYNNLCARCHGEKLLGNDDATPLVGTGFLAKWDGKSVGALVELTRTEMPSDGPGKLTRKQCTDITAYLLNANGFPAGQSELLPELDVLNGIQLQTKK